MNKKNLFIGIVVALIGILLLAKPQWFENAIIILLGLEAIANGLYSLMITRKLIPDSTFQYSVIIRSMLSVVIGFLAVIGPMKFNKAVTVLIVVLGIYLILAAILQMFIYSKLRDVDFDRKNMFLEACLSVIIAVVLFIIAANKERFIQIIGGILLFIGLIYLFILWKNRPIVQEPVEVVDDVTGDVEKSSE